MNLSSLNKFALCLTLGSCVLVAVPARAQTGVATNAPQVPELNDVNLPTLALSGQGAISLRASLAGLRANPAADAQIKAWVARGNVVFLHTDAARSFGFATAPIRPTVAAQGGQEFVRTRAALPFAAHPLLRGETNTSGATSPLLPTGIGVAALQSGDVARLPGVSRVFGTLRDDDVLVLASNVATPLLQVEDVSGESGVPQFASAITSLGAGWAIFCPDEVDQGRGDGAVFAGALADFVPGVEGQHWVGVPTRTLTAGTISSLADALEVRLSAANATNGSAALPAFGTGIAPVVAPPVSEPTLPLERDEAASFLQVLRAGGVRATARVALMQARLALQNGDGASCAAALDVAAADPALSSQIDFWNACLNAQLAADTSLPSPQRANLFDLAARTLARSASLSSGATSQSTIPSAVSLLTTGAWSQRLARLAAISALSPPVVRTLIAGGASASIRFFPGDPNEVALESSVLGLLNDRQFGWRAPHVEVVLLSSSQNFFALRRALGRGDAGFAPDGDQIGDTILLASGSANDATLKRLWSRVLLSTWSDDARPLPSWLSLGTQGVALGGNSPAANAALRRAARAGNLSLFDEANAGGTTPLGLARSTALVEWLYARFGIGAGNELVARLAAGRAPDQSIEAATGETLDELDNDWRRFLGA